MGMMINSMQKYGQLYRYNSAIAGNPYSKAGGTQNTHSVDKSPDRESVRELKKRIAQAKSEETKKETGRSFISSNRTIEGLSKYSESIRNERTKAKDTSLQKKKLKYNFKNISSKILRSKTSVSARKVASEAKREVVKLKQKLQGGGYDEEEITAAITHAQAMERVAKKKARHLEEEELAKIASGCNGATSDDSLEEIKENSLDETNDEELDEHELDEDELGSEELQEKTYEETDFHRTEYYSEAVASVKSIEDIAGADMVEELLGNLSEDMKEMMEELGLDELSSDSLKAVLGDMEPEDLKMMKIKHRNKEMKDIVKADADYLKVVFDNLQQERTISVDISI